MNKEEPGWVEYNAWVVENGCDYCKEHGGGPCLICKERWFKDQYEKWLRRREDAGRNGQR